MRSCRRAQVFPDDTHGFARAANLLLEVGKNEKQSAGASFAGVEIKGVRHLDVAVKASANIERLANLSFAGFIVDYHVGSQYTKRVGLSMGEFDERQRKGNKPLWGKLDMTDEYINLGKHDLYRLDLQEWAPPGWDGQSWVTLALQHAGLGTSITAQLAPLAKRQEEKEAPRPAREAEGGGREGVIQMKRRLFLALCLSLLPLSAVRLASTSGSCSRSRRNPAASSGTSSSRRRTSRRRSTS